MNEMIFTGIRIDNGKRVCGARIGKNIIVLAMSKADWIAGLPWEKIEVHPNTMSRHVNLEQSHE